MPIFWPALEFGGRYLRVVTLDDKVLLATPFLVGVANSSATAFCVPAVELSLLLPRRPTLIVDPDSALAASRQNSGVRQSLSHVAE
jgi:hypothetical protein